MKKFHKGSVQCRNCGHMFFNHCLFTEVKHGMNTQDFIHVLDVVPCNEYVIDSNGISKTCLCLKWETTDNLEWLEQKAAEQENDK